MNEFSLQSTCLKQMVFAALMALTATNAVFAREVDFSISQVLLDQQQFDPQQGQKVTVSFYLNQPAVVKLVWYDGRDLLVREMSSQELLPVGQHEMTWDGKDEAGRWVPDEAYHYSLQAEDESHHVVTYDLTEASYGKEIQASSIRWDPESHRIFYRLSEASRVNIRVGLSNNGPLLRTVTDWLPRTAGDQSESWDGWDESAVLDISSHPRMEIAVNAFSLGMNAVIVGKPSRIQVIDDVAWPEVYREQTSRSPKRMYQHAQQALMERCDIRINLSLPDGWPRDESGNAIVSGIVPVRLEVAEQDRQRALDRRFEPVFFIDGAFAFENEVGYLPTTWLWNTNNIEPGQHFINANLRGYEGNFGMASLPVIVIKEHQID